MKKQPKFEKGDVVYNDISEELMIMKIPVVDHAPDWSICESAMNKKRCHHFYNFREALTLISKGDFK